LKESVLRSLHFEKNSSFEHN